MMNVTWRLPSEELEQAFVKQAQDRGLVDLKGHRSVGGIRASIYNAMPTRRRAKRCAISCSIPQATRLAVDARRDASARPRLSPQRGYNVTLELDIGQ